MPRIETKKKVTRTLKFSEIFTNNGEYAGGGINNSINSIEEEIWVQITGDPISDSLSDSQIDSGRLQIHLGGSQRAFRELGVFLLALGYYEPKQRGYSMSFMLKNAEGEDAIHLVIHLPQDVGEPREDFPIIHSIARAFISKDGKSVKEK